MDRELISQYLSPLSPLATSMHPGGKLKEKIQCVLFDIYGTLFISGSGDIGTAKKNSPHIKKIERLLVQFGIRKTPQALLKAFFSAIEDEHEKLRKIGIDYPEVEIDQIWMRVLENVDKNAVQHFALEFELIVNPVYPMPHLKEVLSACKDSGLVMGIISNAQFYTSYLFEWFLNSSLASLGFHPELISLSYKLKHAKPSLLPFERVADELKKMGIHRSSVLYIGNDMLNDIYPARFVGFNTALFAGDARSLRLRTDDPRCRDLSADLVITDLDQLIDHLS